MKLLMVATSYVTIRGFLLPFAAHFRAQKWHVDGMANGISGCPECVDAFDSVWERRWSRNPYTVRNMLIEPRLIRDLVERNQYDIVHVHTPTAAFVTRFALRNRKRSDRPVIIYTAHGFHFTEEKSSLKNSVYKKLEKTAGAWTDYLVVINKEDRAAAMKNAILPPERICVMPGIGIDPDFYHPSRVDDTEIAGFRRQHNVPSDAKLLFMAAEFIPRKRHLDLVRAFSRLGEENAYLLLAGDGPCTKTIQAYVDRAGLRQRVLFLGFKKDIRLFIKAASALILTSEQEGLPRTVMEAMSMKTPVVATNIRGTRELLDAGNYGTLVEVGDIDGLAEALTNVLKGKDDVLRKAEQGREIIEREYALQHILRMHESLYETVLERH